MQLINVESAYAARDPDPAHLRIDLLATRDVSMHWRIILNPSQGA